MKKILKTILLVLNILVLLVMLGSTMAGLVAPSRFIGFSLLSYGYLYLVLLNVVFVVVWLLMGSKWFLLSLAGILVRVGFLPLYFQVGGSDQVDDAENRYLKVMTFNAHHFRGVENTWNFNDSNMLDFIRIVEDEKPDVLALQEYLVKSDTLDLTERLNMLGYVHNTSGNERGSTRGLVVFSKMPIVNKVCLRSNSKLYVDLLWDDDTVRLFNLHLDSYHLDDTDKKQIHDLSHGNVDSTTGRSTMHKFRETILAHEMEWDTLKPLFDSSGRLTIVAGDFNDTPASYFYQQCRKLFVDSYCEVGQGFSTTYHGVFTRGATFPAFRIDMVLHTSDLEAVAYRRLKSGISDHYPVVVTLGKVDD